MGCRGLLLDVGFWRLADADDAMATDGNDAQQRKPLPPVLRSAWREFEGALDVFDAQREQVQHGFAFAFVEGILVQVWRAEQKVRFHKEEPFSENGNEDQVHNTRVAMPDRHSTLFYLLAQALRAGHWLLLDEVNLASHETLECLNGLLESASSSVVLAERGDTQPIYRQPGFRYLLIRLKGRGSACISIDLVKNRVFRD